MQSEIENVSRACGLSDFRYVKFAPANFGKQAAHLPEQSVEPTALIPPDEALIEAIPAVTNSLAGVPHKTRFQLFAEIRTETGMPTSMTGMPVPGRKLFSTSRPLVGHPRRPARSVSARMSRH